MKEKINLVQLTNNQKKEVTAGAIGNTCTNPDHRPVCKCASGTSTCLQVSRLYPHCID